MAERGTARPRRRRCAAPTSSSAPARQHEDLAPAALPGTPVELWGRIDELAELCDERSAEGTRVCVLASGDPGFFGIVRGACGAARSRAARRASRAVVDHAGIRASRAAVGRRGHRDVPRPSDRTSRRLGRASSQGRGAGVARLAAPRRSVVHVIDAGCDPRDVWVCSRLGEAGESVTQTDLGGLAAGRYDPLSVVVFVVPGLGVAPTAATGWGRDESEFEHRAGLITKAEVRAVVLGKLDLPPHGVLWDVGAGSGSVGIEAARLVPALARVLDRTRRGCRRPDRRERDRHDGGGRQRRPRQRRSPSCLTRTGVFVGGGGLDVLDAALDGCAPAASRSRRTRRSDRSGRGRALGFARADPGEPGRTHRRRSTVPTARREPCVRRLGRAVTPERVARGVDHAMPERELADRLPYEHAHGAMATDRPRQLVERRCVRVVLCNRCRGPRRSARCSVTRSTDPAVVCVDEAGRLRDRAVRRACPRAPTISLVTSPRSIGADAVITTATDAMGVPALDDLPGFVGDGRHRRRRYGVARRPATEPRAHARVACSVRGRRRPGPSARHRPCRGARSRDSSFCIRRRSSSASVHRRTRPRQRRTSAARRDAGRSRTGDALQSDRRNHRPSGRRRCGRRARLARARVRCGDLGGRRRAQPERRRRGRSRHAERRRSRGARSRGRRRHARRHQAQGSDGHVAIARRARPEGSVSVVGLGPGHPRPSHAGRGGRHPSRRRGDRLRALRRPVRRPAAANAAGDPPSDRRRGRSLPRRARPALGRGPASHSCVPGTPVCSRWRDSCTSSPCRTGRRPIEVLPGVTAASAAAALARRAPRPRSRLPQPVGSADAMDRHRATARERSRRPISRWPCTTRGRVAALGNSTRRGRSSSNTDHRPRRSASSPMHRDPASTWW